MLLLNSHNEITFNVNVQGTKNKPVVRCLIGENPQYVYTAKCIDGIKFSVGIDLPKNMTPGEQPFKIEVLLNGKVMTPINKTMQVQALMNVQPAPALPAPAPVQAVVPAQAQTPVQVQVPENKKVQQNKNTPAEPVKKQRMLKTIQNETYIEKKQITEKRIVQPAPIKNKLYVSFVKKGICYK